MMLHGSNESNQKCGTFYRVNDLVSPTQKGNKKRGESWKGTIINVKIFTRKNSQVNECIVFDS